MMTGTLLTSGENRQSVANRVLPAVGNIKPLRKQSVIHALVRADAAGERAAAVDQFLWLTGFDLSPCREEQGLLFFDLPA